MDEYDDYDPGTPWEDRPPRRSRHWDHPDDAWAAAEEDGAPPGDDLDIEDLAAGYLDNDPLERGAHNPNPASSRRYAPGDYPGIDPDSGFLPNPPRSSSRPNYVDDTYFDTSRNALPHAERDRASGPTGLNITDDGMFRPPDTRPERAYKLDYSQDYRSPSRNQPYTPYGHDDLHEHAGGLPFLTVLVLVVLMIVALAILVGVFEWVIWLMD